jgi:hypothetical protein
MVIILTQLWILQEELFNEVKSIKYLENALKIIQQLNEHQKIIHVNDIFS